MDTVCRKVFLLRYMQEYQPVSTFDIQCYKLWSNWKGIHILKNWWIISPIKKLAEFVSYISHCPKIGRVGTSESMCSFGYITMVALLHALPKDVVTNPEKLLPLLWRIIKIDEQTIDWPSFLDLLLPSVPPSLSTKDLSSARMRVMTK